MLLQIAEVFLVYYWALEEHLIIGHELARRSELSVMNWAFSDYHTIRLDIYSRNPEHSKLHMQVAQIP